MLWVNFGQLSLIIKLYFIPNFEFWVSIFWLDWIQPEDLIEKLIIKILRLIVVIFITVLLSLENY
jgi:hypothetical protein